MKTETNGRVVAAVAAAWLSMGATFGLASLLIARAPLRLWAASIGTEMVFVLPWIALTFGIAVIHRGLRARAANPLVVVLGHAPSLLAAACIDAWWFRVVQLNVVGQRPAITYAETVVYFADYNCARYVAVVMLAEAYFIWRDAAARERVSATLHGLLARARLDYLEAQLQPHFLLNALSTVSELGFRRPDAARRVLDQLATIVREAIALRADEVTLSDELVTVDAYLDVQRTRFPDWLTIDFDVSDEARRCLVPHFVLQTLIENAIRHGLRDRQSAGAIRISAAREGGELVVRVADNGRGIGRATDMAGYGIGLANSRERLAILYGDAADRLRLSNNEGGGAVAELRIPAAEARPDVLPMATGVASGATDEPATATTFRSRAPLPRRAMTATIFGVWIVCGFAWAQISVTYLGMRGRLGGRSWIAAARPDLISALVWAGFTPAVFWLVQALPPTRESVRRWLPVYLLAAVGIPAAHTSLVHAITAPQTPLWAEVYVLPFVIDMLIVLALLGIACRRQFIDWLRAREAAARTLREELITARHRAAELQQMLPALLERLGDIGARIGDDPGATERRLARLGDDLRLAMNGGDGFRVRQTA